MVKVKVYITLKSGVLDPQGKAIEHALGAMEIHNVSGMRVGKYMEFYMEEKNPDQGQIEMMCEKLLSNPVIEDYSYETEEVVPS
ncbi:phosphoribosylformylglycinamidine synthase subunit PurS [Halalkalibacillus halophilus]|uniref:phosphoribosylformylglycinamidine synthase subunit PurS n=1 Tax=Halalkalibacillus halophilus TaxID=392827 RepID=UPI00041F633A|nr:phosphoribosylformylglycinamidine synthase subunit PurS [Halalkalibacillus halophilus]